MAVKLNANGLYSYVPETNKEKLIDEITSKHPHFTYGDNAERLWNEEEEHLQDILRGVA